MLDGAFADLGKGRSRSSSGRPTRLERKVASPMRPLFFTTASISAHTRLATEANSARFIPVASSMYRSRLISTMNDRTRASALKSSIRGSHHFGGNLPVAAPLARTLLPGSSALRRDTKNLPES